MSLNIGTALREGFRRTFTREGLLLAVAFVLLGVVSAVATQTILADFFDSIIEFMRANRGTGESEFTLREIRAAEAFASGQTPFAFPIPVSAASLLVVLTAVLAEAARIVTVRVVFTERTAGISLGLVRRNILFATANGIVGGIVVAFIVGIGGILGLVLLIIGGLIVALFLAMSLLFLRQEIAVEDKNFVEAMGDSWSLAKGNRLELLALVFFVVIAIAIATTVPSLVVGLVSPTASAVVGLLLGGVAAVFGTAVMTRAYAQLHAERAAETDGTADEWATY
jgi:hypothetical protein